LVKPLAIAVLSARLAYGVGLMAAPERITGAWLGPAASTGPVQVPVRGLGAREAILHAAALAAALAERPLRPWLAASIAGDLTDIAATAIARSQLPPGVVGKTLAVAGGSALASAALAAALDA
jgi:hypothetical protein